MTCVASRFRALGLVLGLYTALPWGSQLHAAPFIRGDVDANGTLEMADAVRIFGFLFLGTPRALACKDAADANDSGVVDMSDGITILAHLFLGSAAPPAPFPECGRDATEDDDLDCRLHAFCPAPFCEATISQSADVDVGGHKLRYQVQMLAQSVTRGTHISLPGVGHYIHQLRPQVVIDAIRQVVDLGQIGQ